MMRQAGRNLPEYRELRKDTPFMQMIHNPAQAAEVTLQPIRRYGMDAAVIFCDILVPAEVLGLHVEIKEGKGPVLTPPVRSMADLDALSAKDVNEHCAFLGEALGKVRAELGDERAMIGFCGAPFTLASYMIEGQSSRNFEHTMEWMLGRPEEFAALQERVVDISIPYLQLQVDAGADALQIFDSWGGTHDAATYREHMLPHVKRLVAAAKDMGVPVILYINGCAHLLEVMKEANPDVISIDWRVDPAEARRVVGPDFALQGNLNPTILFAPPHVVEREASRVLEAFAGHPGFIFNLGSGILPTTPMESVAALWRTVLGEAAVTS
ncbi:MAG: uroporphyrinogen decarboxylase [Planctomycetota bacterium]|jgi:uroporphyrinogen decarboxylase